MFEFLDGQQYSLSTESGSKKSVLFVKLTDSALNSIENFLHDKDDLTKPTIQFEGNSGTITVSQNGQKIFYGFTLSNLKADGSSFQCIQHATKKCLKSLASMHIKMQVHANEDSYANTKCKMAAVNKEQKSLCTKEIKPNGKQLSKKSTFKHPGGVFPIKAMSVVKAEDHSGFLKPREISNKLLLSKEPIRKRIIHILAIKPFKKPDILLKLIKDGISDEDKSFVTEILNQVTVCKSQVYTLSNNFWNEVDDDWKFYTKEELEIVHRKKQNYLELSSFTTSKKQNSVQTERLDEPQSKKQRTSFNNSHKINKKNVKAGSSEYNSVSTMKTNGVLNDLKISSPNQVNGHSKNPGLNNRKSLKFLFDAFHKRKSPEFDYDNLNYGKNLDKDLADSLKKLTEEEKALIASTDEEIDASKKSILIPKCKITTYEQRDHYKRQFNIMYADYLELHQKIKRISTKVLYLERQMNDCEKGSKDYELYRQATMQIYKETALSDEYKLNWERFHTYEKILRDIKKVVIDYDNGAS